MNDIHYLIGRKRHEEAEEPRIRAACDLLSTGDYREEEICQMLDISHSTLKGIITVLAWADDHQDDIWDDDDEDDDDDDDDDDEDEDDDDPFDLHNLYDPLRSSNRIHFQTPKIPDFPLRGTPINLNITRPIPRYPISQDIRDITYPAYWDLDTEKRQAINKMMDIITWVTTRTRITWEQLINRFDVGHDDKPISILIEMNIISEIEPGMFNVNGVQNIIARSLVNTMYGQPAATEDQPDDPTKSDGYKIDSRLLSEVILWTLSQDAVSIGEIHDKYNVTDPVAEIIIGRLIMLDIVTVETHQVIPVSIDAINKDVLAMLRAFDVADSDIQKAFVARLKANQPPECILWILSRNKLSVADVKTYYHVGDKKARDILDYLEIYGLVSAGESKKPRRVLPTTLDDIPHVVRDLLQDAKVDAATVNEAFSQRN